MTTYAVIATLQGTRAGSSGTLPEPVEMQYYRGDNLARAIVAAGQAALVHDSDPVFVRTLSVRLDVIIELCEGCRIREGTVEGNTLTPCTC